VGQESHESARERSHDDGQTSHRCTAIDSGRAREPPGRRSACELGRPPPRSTSRPPLCLRIEICSMDVWMDESLWYIVPGWIKIGARTGCRGARDTDVFRNLICFSAVAWRAGWGFWMVAQCATWLTGKWKGALVNAINDRRSSRALSTSASF
jgi:hypothetical protein